MDVQSKPRKLSPWAPFWFCAFLGLVSLGKNSAMLVAGRSEAGAWPLEYLVWLPMCFLFAGSFVAHLQGEIRDLRDQVEKLEQKTRA